MLALSIVSPNGANIAAGRKTLEIRTWRPPQLPLRDLLIIENEIYLTDERDTDPAGIAVAVVDIAAVEAWRPWQLQEACARQWTPDMWAWQVTRVRPIRGRFPLPARRKLYEVEISAALRASFASAG